MRPAKPKTSTYDYINSLKEKVKMEIHCIGIGKWDFIFLFDYVIQLQALFGRRIHKHKTFLSLGS